MLFFVFCNTRKWKVLQLCHQTAEFILCVSKKKHKTKHGEPLNANQRKTSPYLRLHVWSKLCVEQWSIFHLLQQINLIMSKENETFKSNQILTPVLEPNKLLVYIYRFNLQAKRRHQCIGPENNSHSGSTEKAGQLNCCGKGNSLLGSWPSYRSTVWLDCFPASKTKRSTPLHCT